MGSNKAVDRPLKKPGPIALAPDEKRSKQVSCWVLPRDFAAIEAVRGKLSRSDWILAQLYAALYGTDGAQQ